MTVSTPDPATPESPNGDAAADGSWRDYLRLARLDHMTKQIFILPGIVLAWMLRGAPEAGVWAAILLGVVAAVAVASANYVINEWLDRAFDAHHPEKSQRAAVQKRLDPRLVYGLYAALLVLGLGLAAAVNLTVLVLAALLAVAGIAYNVQPLRAKDRAYVDVLAESLNNPLRLMLGWAMIDPATLPPVSLLLAFWFGGAFLMNAKRLAEYRFIAGEWGTEVLARYRRSFAVYTEARLSVANLVYALLAGFAAAVFLVKYRIEFVLLFPLMTALFAEYYRLALLTGSPARAPEKLFTARRLMLLTLATAVVFAVTAVVDIPVLGMLAEQHFIGIGGSAGGVVVVD